MLRLDNLGKSNKINPNQKVYIITGYLDEERNKQAIREGACGTIYKPFKVDEIVEIIENHMPGGHPAGKA